MGCNVCSRSNVTEAVSTRPLASCFRPHVLLLFYRSTHPPFNRLSLNVVREVASYLPSPSFLVYLGPTLIYYHDFTSETTAEAPLDFPRREGQAYCQLDYAHLLIVGGVKEPRQVRRLNFLQLEARAEQSMQERRCWPGLIRHLGQVWVFGGRQLKSAERFSLASGQWTAVAAMTHARMCFTPCMWQHEIYLPSMDSTPKPVEVYSPATDSYRCLPLVLQDSLYFGCVAYIAHGELLVLTYSGRLGLWRLDCRETSLRVVSIQIMQKKEGMGACPLQMHQNYLYWPHINGELTKVLWTQGQCTLLSVGIKQQS